MSMLKATSHLRGRPKGSGSLKKPEHKSTVPAKITPELHMFILSEQLKNETFSDTVLRLLTTKNKKIGILQKNVDALEERLRYYVDQYRDNHRERVLIN